MTWKPVRGRWPDQRQELLLHAAVSAPAEAAAAWREWNQRYTLTDLHDDGISLLPMVYRNVSRSNVNIPELARLKGIYRRAWYDNQLLMQAGFRLVAQMQEAEIPVLLLKGAPLLHYWHSDAGIRPLGDVDILVPPAHGVRAMAITRESGWSPLVTIREPVAKTLQMVHAVEFRSEPHGNVDLHTHALEECLDSAADDGFWERALPLALPNLATLRLSAADMLLHICVHGCRGAPGRVVHWVPDALSILRAEEPIDWDVLYREARARRLVIPVRESLRYLVRVFGALVPRKVIARLDRVQPSLIERLDFAVHGRAPGVAWMAARDITRYSRLSGHWPLARRVTNAPIFFESMWGLQSARHIPREAWRRATTRSFMNPALP